MSRSSRLALAAALLGLAGLSVGCSSSKASQVRNNLTPEMQTLHERPDDVKNHLAIYFNESERMFWQDLGRAWYTDRPSRLTPERIPR